MTAAQHPTLLVLDDPNRGDVLVIDEVLSDFSVGSDEGCHLFLSGDDVSPLHARFVLDDEGRVSVCDTNSRAGVFINGGQVMEQALDDGRPEPVMAGDPDHN